MALGPVGQIHISVTDIDTSVAFYRDVLGIPLLFQVPDMPMAFFASGDVRLLPGRAGKPRVPQQGRALLHGDRHRCRVQAAPGPARAVVHRRAPCGPPRRQWRAVDDFHQRPGRPLDRPHATARVVFHDDVNSGWDRSVADEARATAGAEQSAERLLPGPASRTGRPWANAPGRNYADRPMLWMGNTCIRRSAPSSSSRPTGLTR